MDQKRKRRRSPNYPAFTLEEAVNKVIILYEQDGKAGAPKRVALNYWGFESEKSGPSLRNVSTLRAFGLINVKENRIIPSELALEVIIYPHDTSRFYKALQEVALKPRIYNVLYNKFRGEFPSKEALKAELIGDYDFNPRVVDVFVMDFLNTMGYANLLGKQKKMNDEMKEEVVEEVERDEIIKDQYGIDETIRSFPIPLPGGNEAILSFKKLPLENEHLELIKKWIDLFRISLVKKDSSN